MSSEARNFLVWDPADTSQYFVSAEANTTAVDHNFFDLKPRFSASSTAAVKLGR